MQRNIKNSLYIISLILCFMLGWTIGQVFESYALFSLDFEINLFDFISLIVTVLLTIFIAVWIEKAISDKNNDKSFILKELDDVIQYVHDLQKDCHVGKVLSLNDIIYKNSRIRKKYNDLWGYVQTIDKEFAKAQNDSYSKALTQIKSVDKYFTDTTNYINSNSPLKITNGKIYLTSDSKRIINREIDILRKILFQHRCLLNRL